MITNVKIIPWCIACKNCEKICPLVFKVEGQSKVISQDTIGIEDKVFEAERMCPVQVIKVTHTWAQTVRKKAILIKKTMLTPHIVELIFEAKGFSFTPGQYINLFMKDKQWTFSRAYSIADVHGERFALTINLVSQGRWSMFIAKLGDTRKAEYMGPHGFFTLQKTTNRKLFIWTGTGLAPLYAMMKACPESSKKLLIGASTLEDHYWLGKVSRLPNCEVKVIVSKPPERYTWLTGRVTDYLEDATSFDEFYICGNPNMIADVKQRLHHTWIPDTAIYEEAYVAGIDAFPAKERNCPMASLNWVFIWASWGCVVAFLLWHQYAILWDISWWSVVLLMSIRPLADIFRNIPLLRKAVLLRQWLGILSSIIVVTILAYTTYTSWENIITTYTTPASWSLTWYKFFARLSELTAIILLITSNRFSQKLLWKWRKKLHKLAYVYFYTAGIYIFSLWKIEALRSMLLVTMLVVVASLSNDER